MPARKVDAALVTDVEEALKNLYDSDKLQRSRLVVLCSGAPRAGVAPLRQLLLDAIEALKPAVTISQTSRAWRTYWILFHRFVGQFTRTEVATTLGLSVRQVVREEDRSLSLLADYLRSRYGPMGRGVADGQPLPARTDSPVREQELQLLQESLERDVVSIEESVEAALRTVAPLLAQYGVTVVNDVHADAPPLLAAANVLRQAIINALTACILALPGAKLHICDAKGRSGSIIFRPDPADATDRQATAQPAADSLEMTGRLLRMMGGEMTVLRGPDAGASFALLLSLPIAEQAIVLAIDDNADALALYERYLAGTQYRLVPCRLPQQALHLATSLNAALILLDVMLPGMDGWEVLQRLRVDPATHETPIVVCSILPAQQLALALGAVAYLRKPISRAELLAVLDDHVTGLATGSS